MSFASDNNSYSAAATTLSNSDINPASASEKWRPASAQQLIRENVEYLIEQLEAGRSEALTSLRGEEHRKGYGIHGEVRL